MSVFGFDWNYFIRTLFMFDISNVIYYYLLKKVYIYPSKNQNQKLTIIILYRKSIYVNFWLVGKVKTLFM